jgi:deazaflavin-dependent oxidoreductase (nitroreductase family)
MVYQKPPVITCRIVNPLLNRLHPRGVETLTGAGRRTGRPQRVPVVPVQVGTRRYLVAPYGESDWVRNLRAQGEGELDGPHGRAHFRAHELPTGERAAVIEAYRRQTGRTVERLFEAMPDPAAHPVFALDSTDAEAG